MTKSSPVGITYVKLRNKHYVICMKKQPINTLYDVIDITSSMTSAFGNHGRSCDVEMCWTAARLVRWSSSRVVWKMLLFLSK